jgi:hypothetical protein
MYKTKFVFVTQHTEFSSLNKFPPIILTFVLVEIEFSGLNDEKKVDKVCGFVLYVIDSFCTVGCSDECCSRQSWRTETIPRGFPQPGPGPALSARASQVQRRHSIIVVICSTPTEADLENTDDNRIL